MPRLGKRPKPRFCFSETTLTAEHTKMKYLNLPSRATNALLVIVLALQTIMPGVWAATLPQESGTDPSAATKTQPLETTPSLGTCIPAHSEPLAALPKFSPQPAAVYFFPV